jgi:hypothetical protein
MGVVPAQFAPREYRRQPFRDDAWRLAVRQRQLSPGHAFHDERTQRQFDGADGAVTMTLLGLGPTRRKRERADRHQCDPRQPLPDVRLGLVQDAGDDQSAGPRA